MSALIKAYERSYAKKNQGIKEKLNVKKNTWRQEQERIRSAGEEQMRQAYAQYMRANAVKDQQSRAVGRFGGAAVNAKNGLGVAHQSEQQKRLTDTKAKIAEIDEQILRAEASAQKSIAANETALQLKKDQQKIKEEEKAAQEAKKAAQASKKKTSNRSSGGLTNSQVISLMKMGIYDPSYAGILGIPDSKVREYINNSGKKTTSSTGRLPGTYKEPLR